MDGTVPVTVNNVMMGTRLVGTDAISVRSRLDGSAETYQIKNLSARGNKSLPTHPILPTPTPQLQTQTTPRQMTPQIPLLLRRILVVMDLLKSLKNVTMGTKIKMMAVRQIVQCKKSMSVLAQDYLYAV